MNSLAFGRQLRVFRQICHDPSTGKGLTQEKLGELLGQEMGDYGFSGAAISDWERGKSKINVNDRLVLTSLIKILKHHGGIKTVGDANLLLEAGNYRALNAKETGQVFPGEADQIQQLDRKTNPSLQTPNLKFLLSSILLIPPLEIEKILLEAKEGPSPYWLHLAVTFIHKVTDQWSIFHVLKAVIWTWIWWTTYLLIAPSLRWPFTSKGMVFHIIVLYVAGSIIIPLFIGAMVNTKDQLFWQTRKISNTIVIRLYVYQGAYIGFHLGYFLIFLFVAIKNQFDVQTSSHTEITTIIVPMIVSYGAAHLVPYNLWRAYHRLDLRDGTIFFIFVILGPIWACFFLKLNQNIDIFTILTATTILTGAMALQYQRKGNTNIPALWIIVFYGLIFLCQILFACIQ